MSENKFELKILKDPNGNEIDIKAMSLETVQKFMVLVESITKIVELTPDHSSIRINISEGSAVVAAEGDSVKVINEDFEKVKILDPSVRHLFEPYRKLKSLFSANGYQYEANQYIDGQVISIYQELKNSKALKSKRTKKSFEFLPVFISGELFESGGKTKKNMHVQPDGGGRSITISCTKEDSRKARNYLESNILLSAWVTNNDEYPTFYYCDAYSKPETYHELKNFIEEIREDDELEALSKIHDKSRELLDAQEFGMFRKFLRLFIHESIDVNILKELLLMTQSLKNHERIKESREKIQEIFDKKMKAYKKINPYNAWH